MIRHVRLVCSLLAVAFAPSALSAAQAADNIRYISIAGHNSDPCTLAKPCKTLQRGINMTPAGGELRILNSGFYGNLANVNRSITITGNGNTMSLGAELNASRPGTVVVLRDLTLNGQNTIQAGLRISAAATVHIERCVIHGFTNAGILLGGGPNAKAYVIDSTVRNAGIGLLVAEGTARISNSAFTANAIGINIVSGVVETRQNNIVRGNTTTQVLGGALTPFVGL